MFLWIYAIVFAFSSLTPAKGSPIHRILQPGFVASACEPESDCSRPTTCGDGHCSTDEECCDSEVCDVSGQCQPTPDICGYGFCDTNEDCCSGFCGNSGRCL